MNLGVKSSIEEKILYKVVAELTNPSTRKLFCAGKLRV
jgi:hypothetical protein